MAGKRKVSARANYIEQGVATRLDDRECEINELLGKIVSKWIERFPEGSSGVNFSGACVLMKMWSERAEILLWLDEQTADRRFRYALDQGRQIAKSVARVS